jgi:peptidyl-prolyl cis-trans isomerase C
VNTRIAILLLALTAVAACQKATPKASTPGATTAQTPAAAAGQAPPAVAGAPGGPAAPAVKPVPAQLPDVLARVNGETISKPEFERALRNLEAQAGGPVPPERRDAILRQLLDQIVALKLLAQESTARKVAVADTEVDARVNQVKGQFPNEPAFTAALAERQMTPEKLKADIRQQMQAMKLVDTEVAPTVTVGDADIATFYQQNPDKFQQPEAVHAAHILIRLPEKADDAAKKKARADADKVLAQAKKAADFAALAKQYSQDSGSAVNGGDLGFVAKGQTVPAFEQAAFGLKPGQLSGIVETPFGFHIIKSFEHRSARTIPLQEAKADVTQFLKQQQMQEKTNAFIEKLKAKAKVQILI